MAGVALCALHLATDGFPWCQSCLPTKVILLTFFYALSDSRFTTEHWLAEDDLVAIHRMLHGIQTG